MIMAAGWSHACGQGWRLVVRIWWPATHSDVIRRCSWAPSRKTIGARREGRAPTALASVSPYAARRRPLSPASPRKRDHHVRSVAALTPRRQGNFVEFVAPYATNERGPTVDQEPNRVYSKARSRDSGPCYLRLLSVLAKASPLMLAHAAKIVAPIKRDNENERNKFILKTPIL